MSNKYIKDFLIAKIRHFLKYEIEITPDEYFKSVMKYVDEQEEERIKRKNKNYNYDMDDGYPVDIH